MNRVTIHYCYPTSDWAERLGKPDDGGFFVTVGCDLPISPLFETISGAEGFCRDKQLTWEPHRFNEARDYHARTRSGAGMAG